MRLPLCASFPENNENQVRRLSSSSQSRSAIPFPESPTGTSALLHSNAHQAMATSPSTSSCLAVHARRAKSQLHIAMEYSSCDACPVGTYNPSSGASSCMTCPAGQTTAQALSYAASQCIPCSANMYGDSNGGCDACPAGTFSAPGSPSINGEA